MNHAVHDHNGHDGAAQGDDHLDEDGPLGCAVDLGGLQQLPGDVVLKEVPHEDHVAHGHGSRQEQGPHTAQQAGLLDDQVGGDQAAAEVHGDDEEQADVFAPGQVLDAQRIGHQKDHDHRVDGADDGVLDAVEEAGEQCAVCEHRLVALQGELASMLRPKTAILRPLAIAAAAAC